MGPAPPDPSGIQLEALLAYRAQIDALIEELMGPMMTPQQPVGPLPPEVGGELTGM